MFWNGHKNSEKSIRYLDFAVVCLKNASVRYKRVPFNKGTDIITRNWIGRPLGWQFARCAKTTPTKIACSRREFRAFVGENEHKRTKIIAAHNDAYYDAPDMQLTREIFHYRALWTPPRSRPFNICYSTSLCRRGFFPQPPHQRANSIFDIQSSRGRRRHYQRHKAGTKTRQTAAKWN